MSQVNLRTNPTLEMAGYPDGALLLASETWPDRDRYYMDRAAAEKSAANVGGTALRYGTSWVVVLRECLECGDPVGAGVSYCPNCPKALYDLQPPEEA